MGKSKKKSNKGAVAAPLKSNKKGFKGKKNAEGAIGKLINAKKQKKDVAKEPKDEKSDKKSKITFVKAPRNREETSTSEDLGCSDAEEEVKAIPQKEIEQKKSTTSEELSSDEESMKRQPSSIAKNGDVVAKKVPGSGSESGSDENNSDEEKSPENSKGGSSESESESEEGTAKIGDAKNGKLSMPTKKRACENSESESDEEEKPAKVLKVSDSSHGESLDGSDEEEIKKTPNKKLKVPASQIPQASGSKTLFVGNLSFSIEKADIKEFFKDAGEIADIRFASNDDGRFKGFGHVEFTDEIAAQKALELNGHELLGRQVRLDVARERGTFTPKEADSFQRGPKSTSQTIYVRGFDKSLDEDKIRSSLEEHFGACGKMTRISIPKDQGTGESKGMAYMDFEDKNGFSQALELNNSELGDYTLIVEEAKPRADSHGGRGRSGGRGGRSGGQFGGKNGGGRFGGRRGGNRDGKNRNFRGGRGQRRSGF